MNDFSRPVCVSLDQDLAIFSNEYSQPNGSSVKHVPIGSLDVFIRINRCRRYLNVIRRNERVAMNVKYVCNLAGVLICACRANVFRQ